ncbi:hypothetical protein [Candidatus Pelagibacter sp. Uisw_106]|uniref:hypothetical protein n=1 Tax=Candidatus Pelagibacter sp. Uisw_106 TaxID=3230984 RepID=UPI0039E8E9CE
MINFILWKNYEFITLKLNLYDTPNDTLKPHKKKISIITGSFILINIFIIFLTSIFTTEIINIFILSNYKVIYLCLAIFLLGYIDDNISLNPSIRILFFFTFFYFFLYFDNDYLIENIEINGYDFTFKHSHAMIFSTLCFLIYINAFNFFDGINFQSGFHVVFIYLVFLFKLNFSYEIFSLLFFYIIFLYFNGKNMVFLGNSGAYLSATLISIFLIYYYKKHIFSAAEIFVLMSLPGLDMLRIFISRLSKLKNPFNGDLNHIHHLSVNKLGLIKSNILISFIQILNYAFFLISKNEILSICFTIMVYILLINFTKHRKINE